MEFDNSSGQHAVKGANTILGKVFAYQEKTGMPPEQIMKLPYVMFVIGMLDAPSVNYNDKKDEEKTNKPKTAGEEMNAVAGLLG